MYICMANLSLTKVAKELNGKKTILTIKGMKTADIHMQEETDSQILSHTRYKDKLSISHHRAKRKS